jgi:hypothetical protein
MSFLRGRSLAESTLIQNGILGTSVQGTQMKSVTDRYTTDALFRALVDAMYVYIDSAQFSPTEIREAAMLAHILYEERRVRPMILDSDWLRHVRD